jgi:hypothetical protein
VCFPPRRCFGLSVHHPAAKNADGSCKREGVRNGECMRCYFPGCSWPQFGGAAAQPRGPRDCASNLIKAGPFHCWLEQLSMSFLKEQQAIGLVNCQLVSSAIFELFRSLSLGINLAGTRRVDLCRSQFRALRLRQASLTTKFWRRRKRGEVPTSKIIPVRK